MYSENLSESSYVTARDIYQFSSTIKLANDSGKAKIDDKVQNEQGRQSNWVGVDLSNTSLQQPLIEADQIKIEQVDLEANDKDFEIADVKIKSPSRDDEQLAAKSTLDSN